MSKLITKEQALTMLKQDVIETGGVTRWSLKHGVSQSYASLLILGQRPITSTIAAALGLEEVETHYRRITK